MLRHRSRRSLVESMEARPLDFSGALQVNGHDVAAAAAPRSACGAPLSPASPLGAGLRPMRPLAGSPAAARARRAAPLAAGVLVLSGRPGSQGALPRPIAPGLALVGAGGAAEAAAARGASGAWTRADVVERLVASPATLPPQQGPYRLTLGGEVLPDGRPLAELLAAAPGGEGGGAGTAVKATLLLL